MTALIAALAPQPGADDRGAGGFAMSLVFLLGLMIGAAPPPVAPTDGEGDEYITLHECWSSRRVRVRELAPGSGSLARESVRTSVPPEAALPQLESLALPTEEAAERLDADPWLSARERCVRRQESASGVTLCDVLALYAEFDEPQDRHYGRRIPAIPDAARFAAEFTCYPAFAPLLLESLRIRTSDRTPHEKGRRLARLIKPWMTHEQIHALFGESKAVIWDLSESRITYVDYGVSIDRCRRITFRDDSSEAKGIRWDWFTERVRTEAETNPFYFMQCGWGR
jgi:hypothetical protein